MKKTALTVPEIGLIALTRVALGAGLGLLLSGKMDRSARRAAGVALFSFGVLTTFPLVANILCKRSSDTASR
jgi:putative Mn2+ efflux pump MntP